jgi:methionyl-tRNA synthetase
MVPQTAARAEEFLGVSFASFDAVEQPLLNHEIKPFSHIQTRVDPKKIETMIEASKESLKPSDAAATPVGAASAANAGTTDAKKNIAAEAAPTTAKAATGAVAANAVSPVISIDDFARLDLRVGKVLACEFVDGSDKLLRFELDAGELGKRQIFSGIRAAYGEPEKLVGRNVVFIANLAPRKMRFGVSEGMILSAGTGGDDLFLLDADAGAQPGATVK